MSQIFCSQRTLTLFKGGGGGGEENIFLRLSLFRWFSGFHVNKARTKGNVANPFGLKVAIYKHNFKNSKNDSKRSHGP